MKVVVPSAQAEYTGTLPGDGETYVLESYIETDIGSGDDSESPPKETIPHSTSKKDGRKHKPKVTTSDAMDFVLERGFTVAEAIRATMNPCT